MSDETNKMMVVVLETVNSLRDDLRDHIKLEDAELMELRKAAESRNQKADERHEELLQALNKVNIVDALPKNTEGNPDVHGHRLEHERSRRRYDWIRDYALGLVKDGSKYLLGGFAIWALINLWQAFLQGPK